MSRLSASDSAGTGTCISTWEIVKRCRMQPWYDGHPDRGPAPHDVSTYPCEAYRYRSPARRSQTRLEAPGGSRRKRPLWLLLLLSDLSAHRDQVVDRFRSDGAVPA